MANADFGTKSVTEITSPMVLACLRKVEAKGNYETAKRFAVANGVADTDPTYALRDALIRPTVTHRAAITDPKALGGFVDQHMGQQARTGTAPLDRVRW